MPALMPTSLSATVTWIGTVPVEGDRIVSAQRDRLQLGFDGPEGERHSGRTRLSCSRVTSQHPKGTEIANVRQLSIVSKEELDLIASEMGLDALDPVWLGATLVIEGIPDFTQVPPSSRLQADNGTTLILDMENRPCHLPAREIEAVHPGLGRLFKPAAKNRRGVTAWVERPGEIALGDSLRLHIPDQPVWPHLDALRNVP